jgi:hypothetical protein
MLRRIQYVVRGGFWAYLIVGFGAMSLAGLISGAYTILVITLPSWRSVLISSQGSDDRG